MILSDLNQFDLTNITGTDNECTFCATITCNFTLHIQANCEWFDIVCDATAIANKASFDFDKNLNNQMTCKNVLIIIFENMSAF